jgi:hypothetical protein
MDGCSSCGYEVLPGEDFCTNCGNRRNPAAANFHNPAVEAVTSQLDQATQRVQAPPVPPRVPPVPDRPPRAYTKPPFTIGGWSFFDKVRFRWGGGGDIVLGIALIGGGHSAGATVFGLLFIALGIATWILTQFGVRGRDDFGDDWYSAWNSMPDGGKAVAGTGSVIGMLFLYILFFWFFIIIWIIKILTD